VSLASDRVYLGTPQELLAVMDSKNVRAMVNLTGGYDKGLGDVISKYDCAFQDRFYAFTEPCYERFRDVLIWRVHVNVALISSTVITQRQVQICLNLEF